MSDVDQPTKPVRVSQVKFIEFLNGFVTNKVGCVFPMSHAEFGQNDHWKDVTDFIFLSEEKWTYKKDEDGTLRAIGDDDITSDNGENCEWEYGLISP